MMDSGFGHHLLHQWAVALIRLIAVHVGGAGGCGGLGLCGQRVPGAGLRA
jgi:hypothetical protein